MGYYKAKYPKRHHWPNYKRGKDIMMTILEAILVEPTNQDWWIYFGITRYVGRDRYSFMNFKANSQGNIKSTWGITLIVMYLIKEHVRSFGMGLIEYLIMFCIHSISARTSYLYLY